LLEGVRVLGGPSYVGGDRLDGSPPLLLQRLVKDEISG